MGYQERKRDFHEARWDEPIIMELGSPGERGVLVPKADPGWQRPPELWRTYCRRV